MKILQIALLLTLQSLALTQDEVCDIVNDVKISAMDCHKFMICEDVPGLGLVWIDDECPDKFIPDQTGNCIPGTCDTDVIDPETETFDCAAAGANPSFPCCPRGFQDPKDCTKYWWCWLVNGRWTPVQYNCPPGTFWRQYGETCVHWSYCPQ